MGVKKCKKKRIQHNIQYPASDESQGIFVEKKYPYIEETNTNISRRHFGSIL